MITKTDFENAKALIEKYGEQCIAKHDVKTGDIYKYNDDFMTVKVVFHERDGRIVHLWTEPNNYKIENGEIKFYITCRDDKDIFEKGEKVEQTKGKELERLQELNELAEYDFSDIDSKLDENKLRNEHAGLLEKCCHDWKAESIFSSDGYTCKVCNFKLRAEQN